LYFCGWADAKAHTAHSAAHARAVALIASIVAKLSITPASTKPLPTLFPIPNICGADFANRFKDHFRNFT
jgi:hypothetical protein